MYPRDIWNLYVFTTIYEYDIPSEVYFFPFARRRSYSSRKNRTEKSINFSNTERARIYYILPSKFYRLDIYIYKHFISLFFFRMEETVRALLKYKSKFEQLKHDRHLVTNSYEVSKSFLDWNTVIFFFWFLLRLDKSIYLHIHNKIRLTAEEKLLKRLAVILRL